VICEIGYNHRRIIVLLYPPTQSHGVLQLVLNTWGCY